jgi:hypothetical protein
VWLAGAIVLLAAAGLGYALARDAQDKAAAPAEASPV